MMNPVSYWRKARERGLKIVGTLILREFRSSRDFAVVARDCSCQPADAETGSDTDYVVITKVSGMDWLARVAEAWPPELEHYREGKLIGALERRIEKGQICIVAHSSQQILGALWITENPIEYRDFREEFGTEWRMVKSLFVTPEARGKGLGRKLLQFTVHFGHGAGWCGLISLILESRDPSLKAHRAAGFKRIGRIILEWNLFSQQSRFVVEPIFETLVPTDSLGK